MQSIRAETSLLWGACLDSLCTSKLGLTPLLSAFIALLPVIAFHHIRNYYVRSVFLVSVSSTREQTFVLPNLISVVPHTVT